MKSQPFLSADGHGYTTEIMNHLDPSLRWTEFFDSADNAVLLRYVVKRIRITLAMQSQTIDAKALMALRKSNESLRSIPLNDLKSCLATALVFTVGVFDDAESNLILNELSAAGLIADTEQFADESFVAFDRVVNSPILMIDAPTTEAMISQMLNDRVPIVNAQ